MNKTLLLLQYGWVESQKGSKTASESRIFAPLATVISNFYYYGYGLSKELYEDLASMNKEELTQFWAEIEPALKEISLDNRAISEHVVYQNFPKEVLDMSQTEYWCKQILMYWGFDKDLFREEKEERPSLLYDQVKKVLQKSNDRALYSIANSLLNKPAKWIASEEIQLQWLVEQNYITSLDEVSFKENLVYAGLQCMQAGKPFLLKTMTDVLRFIVGLSAGDISLKTNSKIKSFKRSERKFLLTLINSVKDMEEGVMRHKNKWIKVFHSLHLGDYQNDFPAVFELADTVRNDGKFPTFNSKVESLLLAKDAAVLSLLQSRPGDFARRLAHCLELFGEAAAKAFLTVVKALPTYNLLKLKKLLELYPYKKFRTIAPKGNWTKLEIIEHPKVTADPTCFEQIVKAIHLEIKARLGELSVDLDPLTQLIKLPSNNADAVLPYGRGTTFIIPDHIKFIRTATYWEAPEMGTVWFDNGWNFFDWQWNPKGTVCWNSTGEMQPAAVFSGDPVSGTNAAGKATQLIDLYLDKLKEKKIRYAVWNILCYSRVPFNKVKEMLGILEMGEDPQKGNLIEPSRADFAFPVTGNALTKYVCYIDIEKKHLVYLDANLKGNVASAKMNEAILQAQMPAIAEYLQTLPSVYDIFESANQDTEAEFKVWYSDAGKKAAKGFIFRPVNEENTLENSSINDLLKMA